MLLPGSCQTASRAKHRSSSYMSPASNAAYARRTTSTSDARIPLMPPPTHLSDSRKLGGPDLGQAHRPGAYTDPPNQSGVSILATSCPNPRPADMTTTSPPTAVAA